MPFTSKFRRVIAGAALASAMTGPILLTQAATANALPISTLQTECRGAGGTWSVEYGYSSTNVRYVSGYECWYRDVSGNQYVDFYDRRGNYTGTG